MAYAIRSGDLPIVAAGNYGDDLNRTGVDQGSPDDQATMRQRRVSGFCADLPGGIPGVVRVGSTGRDSKLSYFSNYGLGEQDVVAPGDAIVSTLPGGTYGEQSGTSMAAPHATGVAALILARHPGLTPVQLRQALRDQARQLPCAVPTAAGACHRPGGMDAQFGAGLVDAYNAVTR